VEFNIDYSASRCWSIHQWILNRTILHEIIIATNLLHLLYNLQTIKRKVVEDKLKSLIRSKCFESQNTENEYYLLIADQQCKPLLKYSESLNTEQNDIARPSVQEKVK